MAMLAIGAAALILIAAVVVAASRNPEPVPPATLAAAEAASPTPPPTATAMDEPQPTMPATATATDTASPTSRPTATVTAEPTADAESQTDDERPRRLRAATSSWNTNWQRHTVPYDELRSGGPPRDGIPSIDDPHFIGQESAAEWLTGNEPVIALELNGEARAYPLQILIWHEIVNDEVGGVPMAVTFCPLCNAAITFDRQLDGQVYEFGTSGLLRNSDLVMYDRTTESLWQQFTGEGIVGDMAGRKLTFLPSSIVSFDDFRQAHPEGVVLSRETGHSRRYGENPYAGYDRIGQSPFLFDGPEDDRLPAMERVVAVEINGLDVAYPFSLLAEQGAINDSRAGRDLVVLHEPGTSSALGAGVIAEGEDVGATGVFDANLDGQKLTFRRQDGALIDDQTGSTWNVLGQAIDGPLGGQRLEPIVHGSHFWFAWAAFKPDTIVYQP
jgi:hypothetical protein